LGFPWNSSASVGLSANFREGIKERVLGEAVSSSLIVEGRNVIITEVVERAATKEILAKTKPLK
jgi:hypothetical protein